MEPLMKPGDTAICLSCLRTRFGDAEFDGGRCMCGGMISMKSKEEIKAIRANRRLHSK